LKNITIRSAQIKTYSQLFEKRLTFMTKLRIIVLSA